MSSDSEVDFSNPMRPANLESQQQYHQQHVSSKGFYLTPPKSFDQVQTHVKISPLMISETPAANSAKSISIISGDKTNHIKVPKSQQNSISSQTRQSVLRVCASIEERASPSWPITMDTNIFSKKMIEA